MNRLYEVTGKHHVVFRHSIQGTDHGTMPILWLTDGEHPKPFLLMAQYLHYYSFRSDNWKMVAARSVGLFYDFCIEQKSNTQSAFFTTNLISNFVSALRRGTLPTDGIDATRLYWPSSSADRVGEYVRQLDSFITFCISQVDNSPPDHPLKKLQQSLNRPPSNTHEVLRFLVAAKKRNERSLLQHLKNTHKSASDIRRSDRGHLGLDKSASGLRSVKTMDHDLIARLLQWGFVKDETSSDTFQREDVTAKMITLLLITGGIRISEPFHLWFNDIPIKIIDGNEVILPRLCHPAEAPTFIHGENINRRQYLAQRGLLPRNEEGKNKAYFAGWKNVPVDHISKSTTIHLIFPELAVQIYQYFSEYLNYRRSLIATRQKLGYPEHPFLFVSAGEDKASGKSHVGAPYSIKAYRKSFERALQRLETRFGDPIPRGKHNGVTPHALRHTYASLLAQSELHPSIIQNALHHRSPLSQEVYTQPTPSQINQTMIQALGKTTISPKFIQKNDKND